MMATGASDRLRRALVAELRAKGVIRSSRVERAFCAVGRERFIAAVGVEQGVEAVYRDEAFVTKRDARGMPLSSSSQPSLMAEMLELLDVRPGQRVLEIGTGTGYNAALLAHMVGDAGRVTTVDVDPKLAAGARTALRDGGHRVSVETGDGRAQLSRGGPFDRIIVTACADEIPAVWRDQLVDGGRVELPLRLDRDGAAIQLIPVLERRGERLVSLGLTWGGFMPLHGGDGGWLPPPATLTATRSGEGGHSALMSISGAGLRRFSDEASRLLLAASLIRPGAPLMQGLTDLDSARPPLLLIYLLLSIPAARRVTVRQERRLGIGAVDQRSGSMAVVSVRSPWMGSSAYKRDARARWRLDAYGGDAAARELERLLAGWRGLRRQRRTRLEVSADGRGDALRVRFAWTPG